MSLLFAQVINVPSRPFALNSFLSFSSSPDENGKFFEKPIIVFFFLIKLNLEPLFFFLFLGRSAWLVNNGRLCIN